MKKLKNAYHYFYYKIYCAIEYTSNLSGGKFWSDWKAGLVVDVLCFFICFPLFMYYTIFMNNHIELGNTVVWIIVLFIVLPNYFIFHHKDQWKTIVNDFDKLPKEKNRKGGVIVWIVIILIICNMLFSYYLLFMQAKQNHTGPYSKEYIEQQKNKDSIYLIK
jgi:amino acid transporter